MSPAIERVRPLTPSAPLMPSPAAVSGSVRRFGIRPVRASHTAASRLETRAKSGNSVENMNLLRRKGRQGTDERRVLVRCLPDGSASLRGRPLLGIFHVLDRVLRGVDLCFDDSAELVPRKDRDDGD